LSNLAEQHRADGLVVLGVHAWSERETRADVERFVRDMKVKYEILLDGRDVARGPYGVTGVPTVFFIDRDGKVSSVNGGGSEADLNRRTASILSKG
jgi:hypothetical protein